MVWISFQLLISLQFLQQEEFDISFAQLKESLLIYVWLKYRLVPPIFHKGNMKMWISSCSWWWLPFLGQACAAVLLVSSVVSWGMSSQWYWHSIILFQTRSSCCLSLLSCLQVETPSYQLMGVVFVKDSMDFIAARCYTSWQTLRCG